MDLGKEKEIMVLELRKIEYDLSEFEIKICV